MASGLAQELKKKQPFRSAAQEALLNLIRSSDQVQHQFARLFRQFDLTPSQYNILRILRGEGKPLPILEIASRTITVVPGITGLIDRLEKAGLVARQRCDKDRRVIFVGITQAGSDLLSKIDEPLEAAHQAVTKNLAPAELMELSRLLEKLRTPTGES